MLEYLDDLASDFSVFHRINDMTSLDAAVFFRLAVRLPAYTGCMAARLHAETEQAHQPATAPTARQIGAAPSRQEVVATPTALRTLPEFEGLFDVTEL